MQVTIFRQPTATDTIIPSDSYHPLEFKLAAIWYPTNRMLTHPINDSEKIKNLK